MKPAKLTHNAEEPKAHTGKAPRPAGRSSAGLKMAEEIVRCPYCVLGDQFRPMLQWPAWFICLRCGHAANPEKPEFKCFCQKCGGLNRAA